MLHTIKITVLILIGFKMLSECCDCNLEAIIKDTLINSSVAAIDKRQLQNEDEDAEIVEEVETNEETTTHAVNANNATDAKLISELSGKSEDAIQATETKSNDVNMNKLCRYYKKAPEFDFEKMADVWKIVYYKASAKLACFKIHIKKISEENRENLNRIFGDFHHAVNWQNCRFEISSSSDRWAEQRHFLQGTANKKGVFENIIVSKDEEVLNLLEQSPDQWLVIKNLLLMRDCDNGDVVVFSRVPAESSLRDIEDALQKFGEEANGNWACDQEAVLRNLKYHTIS